MPEDIRNSLQSIRDIIQGFNIPILELPGYEADDVIGTLAKQKEGEFDVFMVTPDKDFGQLVSENIFMYKPSRQGRGMRYWAFQKYVPVGRLMILSKSSTF